MTVKPQDVIAFWRDEVGPARWFESDAKLDAEIAKRFRAIWRKAKTGKLKAWEDSVEGALALHSCARSVSAQHVPRQARMRSPPTALARAAAERALVRGYDLMMPAGLRVFFYLPFMHSENDGRSEPFRRLDRRAAGDARP